MTPLLKKEDFSNLEYLINLLRYLNSKLINAVNKS